MAEPRTGRLAVHVNRAIDEAAAAGVPDPIYGEEVVGFVVLAPGAGLSSEEILARCRRELPAFKVPRSILRVNALPRNARGKLDRKALVELWSRSKFTSGAD